MESAYRENCRSLKLSTALFSHARLRMRTFPNDNAFNHLHVDDLRAFVTVSRSFQIEAERIIHRIKEIRGRSHPWKQIPSLLATPRLLPLVRILSVELGGKTGRLLDSVVYGRLIASFLEKLPNLHTLRITDYNSANRDSDDKSLSSERLPAQCPFQLRNLSCIFPLDSSLSLS
jgi:hypothetical protein